MKNSDLKKLLLRLRECVLENDIIDEANFFLGIEKIRILDTRIYV